MYDLKAQRLVQLLERAGVQLEQGLSDTELAAAEQFAEASFPSDLAALLRLRLPAGHRFPNWRSLSSELGEQLRWPLEGMCFDIEHNAFWLAEWGDRPRELSEAFRMAEEHVARAPRLIPIVGHRYLPAEPSEAGNPVFSVYQTDIIYYGNDLASFFAAELHFESPDWAATAPRSIRFWSDLVC